MKKGILLAAFGMSFALMACAGQEEQADDGQAPVQRTQVAEAEAETVQNMPESTQADKTQEQQVAAAQQTTEAESETNAEETDMKETGTKETDVQGMDAAKETATQPEAAQAKGELAQRDIAVTVRGVAVVPGEIMENYIGTLGEPDELQGSPSCIEEGDDKTYTYGGVIIYTYRSNGTDKINLIEITGTETLGKGIHIGDTKDAVIAAYGDAYTVDGDELLYEMNDKVIGLRLTDGVVSFMELFTR